MNATPAPLTDSEKKLFKAAKAGDIAAVQTLLAAEPTLVTARDADACTPLHYAAWKGHADLAALLLDAGADIGAHNTNGHWGTTPLHAAAHGNQTAVAALLIERGADIHALNPSGRTPLQETEAHSAKAVANLLKRHGATH